jgi:hypothetical protein
MRYEADSPDLEATVPGNERLAEILPDIPPHFLHIFLLDDVQLANTFTKKHFAHLHTLTKILLISASRCEDFGGHDIFSCLQRNTGMYLHRVPLDTSPSRSFA